MPVYAITKTATSRRNASPRIVRPARNAPKIGCRPSAAVIHALAMASANATDTGLDSTDWRRFVHHDTAGRTATSMTSTKQPSSSTVTGSENGPEWPVPISAAANHESQGDITDHISYCCVHFFISFSSTT